MRFPEKKNQKTFGPAVASLTMEHATAGGGSRENLIAIIVACALFMQNLDSTVIATALPAMGQAFHTDPVHMNVALTAYLFAVSVFIPASGWMADRFGTRNVFRAAIAVFTLGSVLCGRADTLGFLVAARILQGAGGAMMLPVGRLVLLRSVPKERLINAMAWVTIPALIGPVIGPPIGGVIVTYFSWNWIFDINVPIGVLGFVMVSVFIEDISAPDPGRFDFLGLLLTGGALGGFMAVLELAGRGLVPGWALAGLGCLSAVAGVAYVRRARHQARALLDFSLLRVPTFFVSVFAGSLFRIGIGAVPFLLPMMIQVGFGRSPVQSGMITFASAAGAIGMKPATQWVLRRYGFRTVLSVNAVACAVVLAAYAAFRPSWPLAAIYAVLVAGGMLRSLQFTAYNAVAYADVPAERMSAATALYAMLQQVSLTVGIPISAGVLLLTRAGAGHVGAQAGAGSLPSFGLAFLVVAAISALAAPASLLLKQGAGSQMSGWKEGPHT
jgi:EmrB/QacA subfamily drug resistance transporter